MEDSFDFKAPMSVHFLRTIYFPVPKSIDDIVATTHYLLRNKHLLVPDDCRGCPISHVDRFSFTLDEADHHHKLNDFPQIHALEETLGGTVSLNFTFEDMSGKFSLIASESVYSTKLTLTLCNELSPQISKFNAMTELMALQGGPVTMWESKLADSDDPLFRYVLAFGTDKDTYPPIVFKMGDESDGQAHNLIGHLMAKVPIRIVIRIRLATLEKGWKPGDSTNKIDTSTISIWKYDDSRRQAVCIHAREPLATPGGRIALWLSDFLTKEDDTLPEEFKRPDPKQEAYQTPNITISYATIAKAIKVTAAADRTHPVAKHSSDPKFGTLTRRNQASSRADVMKPTRRFSTMSKPAPAVDFGSVRLAAGLPRGATRAAFLGRTIGSLGRLFRK